MRYIAISSSETDIEIGLSVLRNPRKYHWFVSPEAVGKTPSERDTQRDRVSRSVTDGRTVGRSVGRSVGWSVGRSVGRTAGANLEVYIVMGNLRLQSWEKVVFHAHQIRL